MVFVVFVVFVVIVVIIVLVKKALKSKSVIWLINDSVTMSPIELSWTAKNNITTKNDINTKYDIYIGRDGYKSSFL